MEIPQGNSLCTRGSGEVAGKRGRKVNTVQKLKMQKLFQEDKGWHIYVLFNTLSLHPLHWLACGRALSTDWMNE
jgi:hypothetical protein